MVAAIGQPLRPSGKEGQISVEISIALCTFNGERFLQQQLDSLLQQDLPPSELVACDDGSTDSTLTLLRDFAAAASFPVTVVQNEDNLGYSRNFAKAAELCTGDIIAFCDQDDVWRPDKLARLSEIFSADPQLGGVFSDGDLIDVHTQPVAGTLWSSFAFLANNLQRFQHGHAVPELLRRNVVTGMALAIRADCKAWLRSMPDHWPHDSWLALVLAGQGRLCACPQRLVAYRLHSSQQIGAPIDRAEKLRVLRTRGLSGYLALSRQRNAHLYAKDAQQYESLVHAATDLPAFWWMPLVRNKAEHMRRGERQLGAGRAHRWWSALTHWRQYQRYAPTGLAALLRDLLL